MLEVLGVNAAFYEIAYDKSRSVGVGKDYHATLFGKCAQKLLLFLVVKHAEAARFDDDGIDDL